MRKEKGYYLIGVGYRAQLSAENLDQIRLSGEHTEYGWMSKDEFLNQDQHWFLREFVEKV